MEDICIHVLENNMFTDIGYVIVNFMMEILCPLKTDIRLIRD